MSAVTVRCVCAGMMILCRGWLTDWLSGWLSGWLRRDDVSKSMLAGRQLTIIHQGIKIATLVSYSESRENEKNEHVCHFASCFQAVSKLFPGSIDALIEKKLVAGIKKILH